MAKPTSPTVVMQRAYKKAMRERRAKPPMKRAAKLDLVLAGRGLR